MRNVNQKKTATIHETPKELEQRETIPSVSAEQQTSPLLIRLARERRVKIADEQTIPKHRHD